MTAKILLDRSADKSAVLCTPNKKGLTVYHLALLSGPSDAAQALSMHFINILGDTAAMAGIQPNPKKGPKDTPLMLAVQGHQDQVVKVRPGGGHAYIHST